MRICTSKNFVWTKNPVQYDVEINTQNSPKLTCEHVSNIFWGQAPGPPFKGQGREVRRWKRKQGREERRAEGMGGERGEHPQK
jgi:hypothetical protein